MNKTCDDCKWYVYTRMEIDDKGCKTSGYCEATRTGSGLAISYHVSDKTDACPKFEHKQEQKQTAKKCGDCKWYTEKEVETSRYNDKIGYTTFCQCHFDPPSNDTWPRVYPEDMACRCFEKKGDDND